MPQIILASKSPRRQELLKKITTQFHSFDAEIDETLPSTILPEEGPLYLSQKKAEAVSLRFPESVIIGSDTIVFAKGQVLGKPVDEKEAFRMLSLLSGCVHHVITGCTVIFPNGERTSFSNRTEVHFSPMTDFEIEEYIATGEPFDKAGGYGIQGQAAKFIEKIDGDYYSVMGLPVAQLYQRIKSIL